MTKNKSQQHSQNKENPCGDQGCLSSQSAAENKSSSKNSRSPFLNPDPPKPRPLLYWISAALMIGWMLLLLVIALQK